MSNYFSIEWKIENFSFLSKLHNKEEILSPVFMADNLDKTRWFLRLQPAGYSQDDNRLVFQLCKNYENFRSPSNISLDYDMIIKPGIQFCKAAHILRVNKYHFHRGDANGKPFYVTLEKIFGKREILPEDTLTIWCKMRHSEEKRTLNSGCSLARTVIDLERKSFIWTIDNFSVLQAEDQRSISVQMFSNYKIYLALTLKFSKGNVEINIKGISTERNSRLLLGISVQDSNGESAHRFQNELMLRKENADFVFPPIVDRKTLMEAKDSLLPKDILSLKCDLEVYDVVLNRIEISSFLGTSTHQVTLANTNPPLRLGKRKRHVSSLAHELRYLFEEKHHADVSLRVHDEIFPVHKAILCARSPVFKTMFDTDMEEKLTNVIKIDDIEPDIMRRLLRYIYSETWDNGIQWEGASNLYLAAEKYAVLGLKEVCFSYLTAKLSITNVCETLVLADMLNDKNLSDFALHFVQNKNQEVLNSDGWKNFKQNHPALTIDILTRLYENVNH